MLVVKMTVTLADSTLGAHVQYIHTRVVLLSYLFYILMFVAEEGLK